MKNGVSMKYHDLEISPEQMAEFCVKHEIRKLSLFGSVLRDDFNPESDVDVMVEFEPGKEPGLIRLSGMELELAQLLGGRRADLRTPEDLSRFFRDKVVKNAVKLYERK
jgi:uncharacterized protein